MSARGKWGLVVALVAFVGAACTTGDTSSDPRIAAERRIVRDFGLTEDVAECVVDEIEATVGLQVLEDAETPDEVMVQINDMITDCLLVVPGTPGPTSGTPRPPPPGGTDLPAQTSEPDAEAISTTTGAPRSE